MALGQNNKKLFSQGKEFQRLKNYEKAIHVYNKILESQKDPKVYHYLADIYERLNKKDFAIDALKMSAQLYKEETFWREALGIYKRLSRLSDNESRKNFSWDLAEVYINMGMDFQAIKELTTYGEAKIEEKDYSESFKAFDKIIELEPQNYEIRTKYADILSQKGEKKKAIENYNLVKDYLIRKEDFEKAKEIDKKIDTLSSYTNKVETSKKEIIPNKNQPNFDFMLGVFEDDKSDNKETPIFTKNEYTSQEIYDPNSKDSYISTSINLDSMNTKQKSKEIQYKKTNIFEKEEKKSKNTDLTEDLHVTENIKIDQKSEKGKEERLIPDFLTPQGGISLDEIIEKKIETKTDSKENIEIQENKLDSLNLQDFNLKLSKPEDSDNNKILDNSTETVIINKEIKEKDIDSLKDLDLNLIVNDKNNEVSEKVEKDNTITMASLDESLSLQKTVDGKVNKWSEIASDIAQEMVENKKFSDIREEQDKLLTERTTWEEFEEQAQLLLSVGETEDAIDYLYQAADGYFDENSIENSWNIYSQIVDLRPFELRPRKKMVEIALKLKDTEKVSISYMNLYECQKSRGAFIDAEKTFEKLQSLSPNNPAVIAGNVDKKEEKKDETAMDLSTLLEEETKQKKIKKNDINSLVDEFKEEIYQSISSVERENYDAHYDLGITFKEMGLIEEALEEFNIATKSPKSYLKSIEMIAYCLSDLNKKEAAINQLEKVVNNTKYVDIEKIGLRYELGKLYEEKNEIDKAIKQYKIVSKTAPDFSNIEEKKKKYNI